jgi:CRP-like cAMP-binding protein
MSVASERSFAGGARIMREGEQADHVIVILRGWTKICIQEGGRDRIIAERGPGQLVGERGALQVSIRSASVIALEMVHALVVRTEVFAAFVSAHPRVLAIVEGQVYERLTEEPVGCGCLDCSGASRTVHAGFTAAHPASSLSLEPSRQHLQMLQGENCTVLFTDVASFSSRTRNDDDRRVIREAILSTTQLALRGLGDVWSWGDRGDGLVVVVSPSVPTAKVLEHLLAKLPSALKQHNVISRDSAQIQLRVAVNVGPIVSDRMGLSGEAIILAARLVDAPILKKAMARSGASLGVITSTFVYENVIRHGRDPIDMASYSHVRVKVKESRIPAWMTLIDQTMATYRVWHPSFFRWSRLLRQQARQPGQGFPEVGLGRGVAGVG